MAKSVNKGMKRQSLFLMGLVLLLMSSCGTEQSGELIGVQDRPGWNGINPFGMVYVPSGTLTIGQSDQDVFSTYTQRPKLSLIHISEPTRPY